MKKTCSRCKIEKDVEEFAISKQYKSGRVAQCKKCVQSYYMSDSVRARRHAFYSTEKSKDYMKKYRSTEKYKAELALTRSSVEWKKNFKEYCLKRTHGITLEQYNQMLEKQNGVCAICGNTEIVKGKSGKMRALAVDHDHVTGKCRKLLCNRCNRAIGLFKDSSELLRKAAEYLDQHK